MEFGGIENAEDSPAVVTPFESEEEARPNTLRISDPPKFGAWFCSEKTLGEGEDAEPFVKVSQERAFLGVWDGLGGSGGQTVSFEDVRHSAAWFASRLARDVVEEVLAEAEVEDRSVPFNQDEFRSRIESALRTRFAGLAERLGLSANRMKGSLHRGLPTTFAGAVIEEHIDTVRCHAYWAGDSRVYALSPTNGLQQVSTDDLRYQVDALANLSEDSPLQNVISTEPFELRQRSVDLPKPVIVLAATDGCFGYVATPWHFEALVLEAFTTVKDDDAVIEQLRGRIEAVTADDASLAFITYGWGGLDEARLALERRHRFVVTEYVAPFDEALNRVREAERDVAARKDEMVQVRDRGWQRYRVPYESLGSDK